MPKSKLACPFSLLEQRPQLQLARLLCGREVPILAQLGPCYALTPSQCGMAVFVHCELEQDRTRACAYRQGRGPCSQRPLSHDNDDLGAKLHSALQQLCVELLHQLSLGLALLGLEAYEV